MLEIRLRSLAVVLVLVGSVGCDEDMPEVDGGDRLDATAEVDGGPMVDGGGADAGPELAPGEVRVLRDEAGVPHIVAGDLASAMYALGRVHAEDRRRA